MSISDLPKHYHGGSVRLSPKEREKLKEWVLREGWTRQKTIDRAFRYESTMPHNLCAPGVPYENWGGNGKCVCPMCGYITTVTNICRQCPEMPADAEATVPVMCYTHHVCHRDEVSKKWTTHRTVAMVCIS
jgi:hypothetical protein